MHKHIMEKILKYPSTNHLQGSSLQQGDEDRSQVSYGDLIGKYIVVEEKLDGANAGARFSSDAELFLQSRGHYLSGGGREKHFNMFKSWASAHEEALFDRLGSRYLMYGEWMHSKHTVFYDQLPHYFLEFDLFDTKEGHFLSTSARQEILKDSPVVSVPVLYAGPAPRRLEDLLKMIKPSLAKSDQWLECLKGIATRMNLDIDRVMRETSHSDLAEGLYIKVEEGNKTVDRLKWVRHGFLQTITTNDSHWLSRPIIPNQLMAGVDIFAQTVPAGWPAIDDVGLRARSARP